jgi:hypothetical protein
LRQNCAILALVVGLGLLSVRAGETTTDKSNAPSGAARARGAYGRFQLEGDRLFFLEKEKCVVLIGDARIDIDTIHIRADAAAVDIDRQQALAEGFVSFTDGFSTLRCDRLFYDARMQRGYAENARVRVDSRSHAKSEGRSHAGSAPWAGETGPPSEPAEPEPARYVFTVEAGRATIKPSEGASGRGPAAKLEMTDVSVAAGDVRPAGWSLSAGTAVVERGNIDTKEATPRIFGVPVFYLPAVSIDEEGHAPSVHVHAGASSAYGFTSLNDAVYRFKTADGVAARGRALADGTAALPAWLPEPHLASIEGEVDVRTKYGVGIGGGIGYATSTARQGADGAYIAERTGNGRIFGWWTDDGMAEPGQGAPDRPAFPGKDRFRFDDIYHWDVSPGIEFDFEAHKDSDRYVRQTYFQREAQTEKPIESLMAMRWTRGFSVAEVIDTVRTDPWLTRVERLPAGRWDLLNQPVGAGVLLDIDSEAAWLRKRTDEALGVPDVESGRVHSAVRLSRPWSGGGFGFRPYMGADGAWYGQDLTGADAGRGAFLYGFDATFRAYGTFDADSAALDLHGLRHIIEPRIRFQGVTRPTAAPSSLPQFDEVDALDESARVTAGLYQKLQTRRGGKVVDWLGVDMEVELVPLASEADRTNAGSTVGPARVAMVLRPAQGWTVGAGAASTGGHDRLRDAYGGVAYEQKGWRSWVQCDYLNADPGAIPGDGSGLGVQAKSLLTGGVAWDVGTRWKINLIGRADVATTSTTSPGFRQAEATVERNFGGWAVRVHYSYDAQNKDSSVNFSVSPTLVGPGVYLPKAPKMKKKAGEGKDKDEIGP